MDQAAIALTRAFNRTAAERIGSVVTGAKSAEIVPLRKQQP